MLIKRELEIRIKNESFDSQYDYGNIRSQSQQRVQCPPSSLLAENNIQVTNSQEILAAVTPVLISTKSCKQGCKMKSRANGQIKSKFAKTKQHIDNDYESYSETSNISRSLENDESQISEEFITAKDIQNKSSRIKHPQIQRIANELKPSVSCGKIKKSKSKFSSSTFSHQLNNVLKTGKHESSKCLRFNIESPIDAKIDLCIRSVELNLPKI